MAKGIETYWSPDHAGVVVTGDRERSLVVEAFSSTDMGYGAGDVSELALRRVGDVSDLDQSPVREIVFDRNEIPVVILALGKLAHETGNHQFLRRRRTNKLITNLALAQAE